MTDIAFCLYLEYELFHMLDHLSLISIFHHFTFCGRTCQPSGSIYQFCSRVIYENSDSNEKCRCMFKDVKLKDVCNRDITAIFHNSKQWFYSFDFCNPNSDFIYINKTNKQGCLFFKTCNNQKDVCLVFTGILVRTYLNLTKNIYEIFIKKYKHLYCLDFFNDECFSHA